MIQCKCPKCGFDCEFDDEYRGYAANCPKCGRLFLTTQIKPLDEEARPEKPLPGFYKAVFIDTWRLFIKPHNYLFIALIITVVVIKFFLAGMLCAVQPDVPGLNYSFVGGLFLKIICWAALLGLYCSIIRDTAFEINELTDDLEDVFTMVCTSFGSNVARPLVLFYYAVIGPMVPFLVAVVVFALLGINAGSLWQLNFGPVLILQFLFLAGLVLFPMALLTAAVGDSIVLMRPDYFVRPVLKAWPPYIVVLLITAACIVLWSLTGDYNAVYKESNCAIALMFVYDIFFQFFAIITARAIGLYFRHFACYMPW
jgi:hypothetical protein